MTMQVEQVSYAGWKDCYRLFDSTIELIVTTVIGPRIVRFAFVGGENQFYEHTPDMGLTGGEEFRIYGGHRFWVAPEGPRTMHPDNVPVQVEANRESVRFTAPVEPSGIQRVMEVAIGANSHVAVTHRATNYAKESLLLAPWALSVMRPGGRAFLPLPSRAPHGPEHLLPESGLALWSYTDLSDPRWTFSQIVIPVSPHKK